MINVEYILSIEYRLEYILKILKGRRVGDGFNLGKEEPGLEPSRGPTCTLREF